MQPSIARLSNLLAVGSLGLLAWACTDPAAPAGSTDTYYRLRSESPFDGDLIVRADSSFSIGTSELGRIEGRLQRAGDSVQLFTGAGGRPFPAKVAGDTFAVFVAEQAGRAGDTYYSRHTFVREPLPQSPTAGTRWVLRSVNGMPAEAGSGFLVQDLSEYGQRWIHRISYDTLVFVDRVFFRESRHQVDTAFYAGDSKPYVSDFDRSNAGGYTAGASAVVLRYGSAFATFADTLPAAGATFVRRYQYGFDSIEERYERLP